MRYTPGEILNYVHEKELDTEFLIALSNYVQNFSIGEITDKKIEKRGEDFYLVSKAYDLDIRLTDDEILTAFISVRLFREKRISIRCIFLSINIRKA